MSNYENTKWTKANFAYEDNVDFQLEVQKTALNLVAIISIIKLM